MRIAVITDSHLGFGWGTERQEDSFVALKEAMNSALKEKPDLILLAGDIFDSRIPRPEVMARALDLFVLFKAGLSSKVTILERMKKDNVKETPNLMVPPIISIYGTHERRPSDTINPIQILEKAGLLCNLHAESVLLKVASSSGTHKIGIHGLSGVPDVYAKDALKSWNPKPFKSVKNFLMIHQTFSDLIPAVGEEFLSYQDLPAGFDLFILGHIHWRVETKHPKHNTPILIPGSTILTQQNKSESSQPKGYYIVDMHKGIEFKSLTSTREFKYEEFLFKDKRPSEVVSEVDSKLALLLGDSQRLNKPLIKIKLKGTLAKGFMPTDLSFKNVCERYADRALVSVDRSKVTSPDMSAQAEELAVLKSGGGSVDELGLSILAKEMEKYGLNREKLGGLSDFFELLVAGDLTRANDLLKCF